MFPYRFKRPLVIAASALGALCAVLITVALVDDIGLATNATAAAQSTNLVTHESKLSRNLGNQPGILSAGGLSCPWNNGLLLAFNNGVYYHAQKDLDKGDWQKVLDGPYAYLNIQDNTLYALSVSTVQSEGNATVLKGEGIVKAELHPQQESQPETIYTTSDALHPLTFLARQQNVLYTLTTDDTMSSSLVAIDIEKPTNTQAASPSYQAAVAHTFPQGDIQLFVTDSEIVALHNSEPEGWVAEKSCDTGASWTNLMSGSGVLSSACLLGNDLYYSIQEASAPSTLRKQSAAGNFQDIQAAKKVSKLAGTTDALVTKSSDNQIGWISPTSNVWHDLTEKLDSADTSALHSARFGTFSHWAFVDFGNKALLIDMNGNQENIEVCIS